MATKRKYVDPAERAAMRLLNRPMVEWQKAVDRMPSTQRGEVERWLDALIERAARLEGYVGHRYGSGCGDQGHDSAVKESNRFAAKTRRMLGFVIPRKDVRF